MPSGVPCIWVCRRHGYTEFENPSHLATVLGGGTQTLLIGEKFEALEPTPFELLCVLGKAVARARGKPEMFATDCEAAVDPLSDILSGTGVTVQYYPPPSEEELLYSQRTNPHLSPAERNKMYRPELSCCNWCGASKQDDGSNLLQCTRCKSVRYCCRDHQVRDWKTHKRACKEPSQR